MINRIVVTGWSFYFLLLLLFQVTMQPALAQSGDLSAAPVLIPLVPATRAIDEPFSLQIQYDPGGELQTGESVEIRVELRSVVRDEAVQLIAQPVPTDPDRYEVEISNLPSEGAYDVKVTAVTETGILATSNQTQFFAVYHVPRLTNLTVSQPLLSGEPITVTVGINNGSRLPIDIKPDLVVLHSDGTVAEPSQEIQINRTASGSFVAVIPEPASGAYQLQATLPALRTTDDVLIAAQSLNLSDPIKVQAVGTVQIAGWVFSVHLLLTVTLGGAFIYQWQRNKQLKMQLLNISEETEEDIKLLRRDLKRRETENAVLQQELDHLRDEQKKQQQAQRQLERMLSRRSRQKSKSSEDTVSFSRLTAQVQQLAQALATRVALTGTAELPSVEELIETLETKLKAEYATQFQKELIEVQNQLHLVEEQRNDLEDLLRDLKERHVNLEYTVEQHNNQQESLGKMLDENKELQSLLRKTGLNTHSSVDIIEMLLVQMAKIGRLQHELASRMGVAQSDDVSLEDMVALLENQLRQEFEEQQTDFKQEIIASQEALEKMRLERQELINATPVSEQLDINEKTLREIAEIWVEDEKRMIYTEIDEQILAKLNTLKSALANLVDK